MDIVCLFLPTGVVSKLDAKIYFNWDSSLLLV
jgi:hypothetical protein